MSAHEPQLIPGAATRAMQFRQAIDAQNKEKKYKQDIATLVDDNRKLEDINQELRERIEKLEDALNQIEQVTGTCENDHVKILAIIEGVRK